jgi:hypothetical protein
MPASVGPFFLKQTFCEGQWNGVLRFKDCLWNRSASMARECGDGWVQRAL